MNLLFPIFIMVPLVVGISLAAVYLYFSEEHEEQSTETRAAISGSFIDLPLGTVHYELDGPKTGDVVVLVHGFSVSGYVWDPTFKFLVEKGFRVLRFDLYGRGCSDRPHTDYNVELFSRQIVDLMAGLEINEPVNIVGLSMGGGIVADFANRYPEKVGKLTLIDATPETPSLSEISPLQIPIVGEFVMTVMALPRIVEENTTKYTHPAKPPDWDRKYLEQVRWKGFRRALLSTLRNAPETQVTEGYRKLGKNPIPKLIVWGGNDETYPLESSDLIRKELPGAEFHVVDEAGHLPHLECPDRVNPILLEFLKKPT
ncbi:MAG: alpha/beta hydrolase [Proteobacteria bacterium]|nr:alpha/beta hydrolase [Pseudomonadota bacterium]